VNRYAIIKKETGSAGRGGRQRKRKECKMERGWKMLGMVVIGFFMLVSGINADEFMRKSEKATQNDFDNIVAYIVTEDMDKPMRDGAPVLKKGDMVFSYLDPRRKLYMQRFLRKIR